MTKAIYFILLILLSVEFAGALSWHNFARADEGSIDIGKKHVDSTGFITTDISKTVLYGGMVVIILLLLTNISCLCYFNCIKSRNKHTYSKVEIIGPSEDDMQI
eukprot:211512_1